MSDGSAPQHGRPLLVPESDPTAAISEGHGRGAEPAPLASGVAQQVDTPLAVILTHAITVADAVLEAKSALAAGGMSPAAALGVMSEVHDALLEIRGAAQRIQRVMLDLRALSQAPRLNVGEGVRAPSTRPPRVSTRGRVLVVDDDVAIRKVMQRMLKQYDVDAASNGEEALRAIEAYAHYDIILCDLVMPGMDGITLHEELTVRAPELASRMIFVTGGMAGPRAAEFRRRLGARFLDKPFAPPVLLDLVAQLLAAPSKDAEG